MEMDCIPSSMELFPATDEEQWEFIKKIIDDCDYYILIIGGRYGSVADDGASYTEKEYDYAVEKGIKVIALLHQNPEQISVAKSETKPELSSKLTLFRNKVATGRLVKFWSTAAELPGLVALSLNKTIKAYPAVGWVRANNITSIEASNEILRLQKIIEKQQEDINKLALQEPSTAKDLAKGDESYEIEFNVNLTTKGSSYDSPDRQTKLKFFKMHSWDEIFVSFAHQITTDNKESAIKSGISKMLRDAHKISILHENENKELTSIAPVDRCLRTIMVQFNALGLISFESITVENQIVRTARLTPLGQKHLISVSAIKSMSKA
jgi:hypothetical protein